MKQQQQQQQQIIITIQILAPTTINLQIFDKCAASRNLKTSLKTTFYVNICRTTSIMKCKALDNSPSPPTKKRFLVTISRYFQTKRRREERTNFNFGILFDQTVLFVGQWTDIVYRHLTFAIVSQHWLSSANISHWQSPLAIIKDP